MLMLALVPPSFARLRSSFLHLAAAVLGSTISSSLVSARNLKVSWSDCGAVSDKRFGVLPFGKRMKKLKENKAAARMNSRGVGDAGKITKVDISPQPLVLGQEMKIGIEFQSGVPVPAGAGSILEVSGKEGWFVSFKHDFDLCTDQDFEFPMNLGNFHLDGLGNCGEKKEMVNHSGAFPSTKWSSSSRFARKKNPEVDENQNSTAPKTYDLALSATVNEGIASLASKGTVWLKPKINNGEELACLQFQLELEGEPNNKADPVAGSGDGATVPSVFSTALRNSGQEVWI
ncbi:unnamed protein product [Amoebophrya sp. A120]|nr:unnamed protein product [Amoebophrya sp. A120]|eukprot:GSA120T00003878001.1